MTSNVSFWLVPSDRDRRPLQTLINNLAGEYNAPRFTPHVTIYAGEYTDSESPCGLMETAINAIPQSSEVVTLQVAEISYSAEFTKTLYVQFKPSQQLHQISEAIRQHSQVPSDYVLNPHLSLMYHSIDKATKQQLAATIQFPRPAVTFDQVMAIAYTAPVLTKADVENWQVMGTQTLLSKTLPSQPTEP